MLVKYNIFATLEVSSKVNTLTTQHDNCLLNIYPTEALLEMAPNQNECIMFLVSEWLNKKQYIYNHEVNA